MNSSFIQDTLFWIIIIVFLLIVIGMNLSQYTPIKIGKKNIIKDPNTMAWVDPNKVAQEVTLNVQKEEHFTQKSSSEQVKAGSSTYYKWGLPEKDVDISIDMPKVDIDISTDDYPYKPGKKKCSTKKKEDECVEEKLDPKTCYKCDILLNKDINKYVLKSSIPPCPDMSNYVKKSEMKPGVNMDEYIKKSDVEACPKVDMTEFIRKSEIPACPPQVTCPVCPICPKPQKPVKCKEIHEYTIQQHPDMKDYIKKSDILNSDVVKKYINDNYVKKDQCNQSSSSSQSKPNPSLPPPPPPLHPSNSFNPSFLNKKTRDILPSPQMWEAGIKSQKKREEPGAMYVGDSLFATV